MYAENLEGSNYHAMITFSVRTNKLDFTQRLLQRGVQPPEVSADVNSLEMAQLLLYHDALLDPVAVQSSALEKGAFGPAALVHWRIQTAASL